MRAKRKPQSRSKSEILAGVITYVLGIALIGCSIADAAFDPFIHIGATELLAAGLTLVGLGKVSGESR